MIINFVGKTSSGKTVLAEEISKQLNIPLAISTTTRPIRLTEKGNEYHFITEEEFHKLDFIEKREYKVYDGSIWYYGYENKEFEHDNCIAIVDPHGNSELIKYFGKDNVVTFFIYASNKTRVERLKQRGDNPLEITRRLNDDELKFKTFIESKEYYKICNEDSLDLAINEIKLILSKLGVV